MELRGTKTCPKCGAELADGAEFCSACGEKVSVVVDTDPEAEDVTVEEVSEEEKKGRTVRSQFLKLNEIL